jgi:hypothetical protein
VIDGVRSGLLFFRQRSRAALTASPDMLVPTSDIELWRLY